MWQDYVFAIGAIVFIVALIPATLNKAKPPLKTSIPTALVLYVYAFNYVTLKLWYAFITTLGTATLWSILAIQKSKQRPEEK